jgi:tyrosyl-tRNA synthetase
MLTEEKIQSYGFQGLVKSLTFSEHWWRFEQDAVMVNNDDWLSEIKYLTFLREYGTHFS